MEQAALETLRAAGTNGVPAGKDGLPLQITLTFKEAPKSTVFVITASSADAAFSQNFLNALMSDYLQYKQDVRKRVSGETAASISAQVEALERELQTDQDALANFQRTNNLAILQEQGTIAGGYLEKLQTELSDLQLESQLLKATEEEQKAAAPGDMSAGRDALELIRRPGFRRRVRRQRCAVDSLAASGASQDSAGETEQDLSAQASQNGRSGGGNRPGREAH